MGPALSEPSRMYIAGYNGETYIGGSQEWYPDRWRRASGCGPVAASNLIWYKTGQRGGIDAYKALMNEMFTFVTPGMQGVNTAKIFTDGLSRYGGQNGLDFRPKVLEVPARPCRRLGEDEVYTFISEGLQSDAPVAFLNLSNGTLGNLENWHWVTILSLDTGEAEISDGGGTCRISLSEWFRTSLLGGVFIHL
jgi:hypothetical protein